MSGGPKYACARCGTLRSAAEGGTVFTLCDACWDSGLPNAESPTDRLKTALRQTTSQLSLYAKELDAASLELIRENRKILGER